MTTHSSKRTRPASPVRLTILAALSGLAGISAVAGIAGCSHSPAAPPAAAPPSQATTIAEPTTPIVGPTGSGPQLPVPTGASPAPTGPQQVRTTHRPAPGPSCRAGDLSLVSIQADGAAGSSYETVTVADDGHRSCGLSGTPSLVYTDSVGVTRNLPTSPSQPAQPGMTVRPGQRAQFTLRTVNGYGGYDPTSPACAHPVKYQHIALRFADGSRLALTGLVLDVKCEGVQSTGWQSPLTD
ncbi:hypothetical protein GCM10023322_27320 [Rugosimonospora acidiphila]|uniref:DUF4232 domain-containing protein n=1 Tax=Rugosimonospora acidiphila TaxID=556531 RepID=A0ABP9RQQ2_9ACTN